MKKKTVVSFALSLLLVPFFLQPGSIAYAESSSDVIEIGIQDLELSKQELTLSEQEEMELVSELKDSSLTDYEDIVEDFMKESDNTLSSVVEEYVQESDINDEIVYDNTLINEYDIDNNNSIIVTPTEIIIENIDQSEEVVLTEQSEIEKFEEEVEDKNAEEETNYISLIIDKIFSGEEVSAAATVKRTNLAHTATYFARLAGQKIVTVGISAEFTYNGSTVTARTTSNYTKIHVGAGGLWQLKSSKNGVQKPSNKRRIVFQEGTFNQGLTYKGNGLVAQSKYLRVNVECSSTGKVFASSTVR